MKFFKTFSYFILAFVVFCQTQAMTKFPDNRLDYFKGYTIETNIDIQNNTENPDTNITVHAQFNNTTDKLINLTYDLHNPSLVIQKAFCFFLGNNRAGFIEATCKNYSILDNSTTNETVRIGLINSLIINKYHHKKDIRPKLLKTVITQMKSNNCEFIIANLTEKIPPSLKQKFLPLNDQKIKNLIRDNNQNILIFKLMKYHTP